MDLSKSSIFIHFLKFRLSRKFSSNKVSLKKMANWRESLKSSPYYKHFLSLNEDFPMMNKALFMKNFDTINSVGIKKDEALELAFKSEKSRDFTPSLHGISIGLSSGTSGNRGIFLTSKQEKEIWVAAVLDRVIGFSLKKRKVAFFLRANNNLYEAVESKLLAFNFFDIKTPVHQHIEALNKLDADILVAQPSILVAIAKKYIENKLPPSFRKVISVAEVLEDDQKKYLTSVFNCQIEQVYQCTEGFLAYTCKKGNLHLNEDWLKIEKKYVDEKRDRFYPIITDYLRASQPIVNYELNDILHEGPKCSCGANSTVISKIEGRSDDVFRFFNDEKEIHIYPDFIRRAVIMTSDKIRNYMVTLVDERTINVSLEVEDQQSLSEITHKVNMELEALFSGFGINNITIVSVEFNHEITNKFRRVKNEYTKGI